MLRRSSFTIAIIGLLVAAQFGLFLHPAHADATYSGTFTPNTQVFSYPITVNAGDQYTFTMLAATCNAPDAWINVRDSHGNVIAFNDDASPEVGGCHTNSQITITFGSSGTYSIEASTWEYQTDDQGDCEHTLPCNYLDAWGSFTLTIAGSTATNGVTWFTPGDARINGQPGDRVAVFCNANPNTLIVYGVEDNSRGYFLASFSNADLLAAGTKGITKDAGPGNGTVSAMQDGTGNFYVAWNGGQFNATGVGPFSKTFACFK